MTLGKSLLDKASRMCKNDSGLAKRLGVSPVVVAQMKSGVRTITPETAAELADIAGEDAREAAIQTMIERAKGTRREGALREILGKVLAGGVAGLLAFSYIPGPAVEKVSGNNDKQVLTLYTSWNIFVVFFKRLSLVLLSLISPQAGPLFETKTQRFLTL